MSTTNEVEFVSVPLDLLETGRVLNGAVYPEDSQLALVGAGQRLTPVHLDRIARRGITHVRVGPGDVPDSVKRQRTPPPVFEEPEPPRSGFAGNGPPLLEPKPKPTTNPKSEAVVRQFSEKFEQSVVDVRNTFQGLTRGGLVSGAAVEGLVDDCLDHIRHDVDLFLAVGSELDMNQYPMSHGIQVARLAMATGAVLGMDATSLSEMGMGCLLHDVGMLAIDPTVVNSERPLDRIERLELMKHPAKSFEMVSQIPEVPLGTKLVVYQIHERLDGSGYPRGIFGKRIHPFARVAMLADTFVAMTSRRPHRLPEVPYYAMTSLLQRTAKGQFDREAMQGLLDTLSLFPVGSHVELEDGRVGTVVRANFRTHTKPVVECWSRHDPDAKTVVDLTESNVPGIVRPLATT